MTKKQNGEFIENNQIQNLNNFNLEKEEFVINSSFVSYICDAML